MITDTDKILTLRPSGGKLFFLLKSIFQSPFKLVGFREVTSSFDLTSGLGECKFFAIFFPEEGAKQLGHWSETVLKRV